MYIGLFKNIFFFLQMKRVNMQVNFDLSQNFRQNTIFLHEKSSLRLIKQIFYISREFNGNILLGDIGQFLQLFVLIEYIYKGMKCVESNQTWNFRFLSTCYLKYFCRKIYFYKKLKNDIGCTSHIINCNKEMLHNYNLYICVFSTFEKQV